MYFQKIREIIFFAFLTIFSPKLWKIIKYVKKFSKKWRKA